jgi:hypothetical protein
VKFDVDDSHLIFGEQLKAKTDQAEQSNEAIKPQEE